MPATAAQLKILIKSELTTKFGSPTDATVFDEYAEALANAIYTWITTNVKANVTNVATGVSTIVAPLI